MQLYPGGPDCCHYQLAPIPGREAECWCRIFRPLKRLWHCSPLGHPTGPTSSRCCWLSAWLVCWLLIRSHTACRPQWSFFASQQSSVWCPARINFRTIIILHLHQLVVLFLCPPRPSSNSMWMIFYYTNQLTITLSLIRPTSKMTSIQLQLGWSYWACV